MSLDDRILAASKDTETLDDRILAASQPDTAPRQDFSALNRLTAGITQPELQPATAASLGTPEAQQVFQPRPETIGPLALGSELIEGAPTFGEEFFGRQESTQAAPQPTIGPRLPQTLPEHAEAFAGGAATGLLGEFDPNTQSVIGQMANKYDPNFAQGVGEFAGMGASFIPAIGVGGRIGQIPRIAQLGSKVPALARFGARGAVEGGLWGTGREGMRVAAGEEFDPSRLAEEAAYGAAGDVAIRGLGQYIGKPLVRALRGVDEAIPVSQPRPGLDIGVQPTTPSPRPTNLRIEPPGRAPVQIEPEAGPRPKGVPSAKRLRKDERQLRPGGDVVEVRAGKGGKDLERQPSKQPSGQAQKEVKQPWEMTKKEFGSGGPNDWPLNIPSKGKVWGDGATALWHQQNPGKSPWFQTPRAAQKWVDKTHKKQVREALSEGKPVPANVLKDYPDLAKKAAKAPTIPPTAPSKPKAKPTVAPLKEPIVLTKAESSRVRKAFNLDALPAHERRAVTESLNQAKRDKHDLTAFETATEVVNNPRPLSDAEQAGISLKVTELAEKRDLATAEISKLIEKGDIGGAKDARLRADAIDAQVDVLTKAYDFGGTELGRAMNLRKFGIDRESFELTHVLQRARKAKGSKLNLKSTKEFERLSARAKKAEKELKAERAKYAKDAPEFERLQAEEVARIENKRAKTTRKTAKGIERAKADQENILKQLADMGMKVKDVTQLSSEGSYLVGKLAAAFIKEQSLTIEQVARKVMRRVPDINQLDVYQSMVARAPKTQAKARSEATKRVAQLRKHARLLVDLDKAERGVFDKTIRRGKPSQRRDIRDLQARLTELRRASLESGLEARKLEKAWATMNELQDNLGKHYDEIKESVFAKEAPLGKVSLEDVRAKLKIIKRALKVDEELTSINQQLKSGEFIIKERPMPKKIPESLERKEIELIRARKDIRRAISNEAPATARQFVGEGLNFLRTVKATADMSATLRQALALSTRRPIKAARAFKRSVGAFRSKYKAEQIDRAIRSDPNHYRREKAGLFLSEVEGPRISQREENFMSNCAQKIPGFGRLVKASDRHMVSHLNLMRTAAFDDFLIKHGSSATDAELKAWANFVNVASGRGNMNVGKAGEVMSTLFFAPKFALSRVQYPFQLAKKSVRANPRVRNEIIKDQVATASTFGGMLTLAHLAGADVSLDPSNSDFAKVRIGNTVYDFGAGFVQPMRLIARAGQAGFQRAIGDKSSFRFKDDVLRTLSYKAAPGPNLVDAALTGKFPFGGGDFTLWNAGYRTLSPILVESIVDAWREGESPGKVASIAIGEGLGLGVSTYKKKSTKGKKIR